jgi:hypothetical protein
MVKKDLRPPIAHWSHSSLLAFLRNPLAWHKRYVERIYDTPSSPAGVVGRAGHIALQHFYGGIAKEGAIVIGLDYLRTVPDFEINFGKQHGVRARKEKRLAMEREYLQAIGFYLVRPPRHRVLGVEVKGVAQPKGFPLPLKAVSDLVVESREDKKTIDIVDHKFVDSFSSLRKDKPAFLLQAMFNYHVARELFGKEVRNFIVFECRKRKNADGSAQMRRYTLRFADHTEDFTMFRRLITDATNEAARTRVFLPNPSDLFDGDDSFTQYRLGLGDV